MRGRHRCGRGPVRRAGARREGSEERGVRADRGPSALRGRDGAATPASSGAARVRLSDMSEGLSRGHGGIIRRHRAPRWRNCVRAKLADVTIISLASMEPASDALAVHVHVYDTFFPLAARPPSHTPHLLQSCAATKRRSHQRICLHAAN